MGRRGSGAQGTRRHRGARTLLGRVRDDQGMARYDDDETPWSRTLLMGLGALVAVSLLVGAVVGVVALGAAKLSGIDSAGSGPTQEPSLYIPTGEPSTSPEAFPDPPEVSEPSPTEETTTAEPSPTKKPRPDHPAGLPRRGQRRRADQPHRRLPDRRGRHPPGAALRERLDRLPGHRPGQRRHLHHLRAHQPHRAAPASGSPTWRPAGPPTRSASPSAEPPHLGDFLLPRGTTPR